MYPNLNLEQKESYTKLLMTHVRFLCIYKKKKKLKMMKDWILKCIWMLSIKNKKYLNANIDYQMAEELKQKNTISFSIYL